MNGRTRGHTHPNHPDREESARGRAAGCEDECCWGWGVSIWCSWPSVGYDPFDDPESPQPRGGRVLTYADGFSNHYPDDKRTHELPANVGICHAAPWCVPGHNEGEGVGSYVCTGCGTRHSVGDEVGDFVRLTVAAQTGMSWWTKDGEGRPSMAPVLAAVVMDEAAARQLAADLMEWADRPKVTALAPTPTHTRQASGDAGVAGDE